MNPVYSILESPHRWLILAGIAFLAALVGTISMLAWGWPHGLARVWFYADLALAISFVVTAVMDWKNRMEEALDAAEEEQQRRSAKS